ncbi:UDP-glucose 4-epimerase GalE [uncultured Lamprocystis sp.]|jgi:UDP-arabinose 4-epimerase|uniref:UDP-glucose 4-epimerase GalE n=1 Tax=uncultured Lamprocystis sp. TaxID=543132 RepID=UPI0025D2F30D|nr:UDP-glucose 4-epimerase GalE [uncultured Lamprocystis sp.]
MNILVTGGAGYIGSHACKALAQEGYTPVSYDNLVYGHRWAVRWGPLEEGDIADRVRLDAVIQRYRPAAVMHFAAYAYVGESVQNPGKYYRNNVAGSLTLLEALRDRGIDKLIFSSTCATYGVPEQTPIDDQHPQRPINPYGASNLMIERMLGDFDTAHGLKSIVLRYFNAAGADPEAEIGEAHDPETHLIPLVLDAAAGQRPAVTVHGDDYATPDGTCIRDYIHVTDLAQAHVLALQALEQGAESTAYNLGNGQGFSVHEVIEQAKSVTGKRIPVEIGPRRPGDPARLVGDASRIRRALGWQPEYADLASILATAWRWHTSSWEARTSPVSNGSAARQAGPTCS